MMPSKAVMDQRFAEKMKAIKEGRSPVFVTESASSSPDSVEAMNTRFREKLRLQEEQKRQPAPVEELETEPEDTSPPESDQEDEEPSVALNKLTKAQICEVLKANFGIEVGKDDMSKEALVSLYIEKSSAPQVEDSQPQS